MFANEVPVYEDNDLIGTDETTSDDNFDRDHPLYRDDRGARQAVRATTRRCEPAPRSTAYSSDGPGRLRLLPHRPRRAHRVRRRAQQQRGAGHRRRADVLAARARGTGSCRRPRRPGGACPRRLTDRRRTARSPSPCRRSASSSTRPSEPVPASDAAPGIDITSLEHGDTVPLEHQHRWDGHAGRRPHRGRRRARRRRATPR